jgi:hypothetical protein
MRSFLILGFGSLNNAPEAVLAMFYGSDRPRVTAADLAQDFTAHSASAKGYSTESVQSRADRLRGMLADALREADVPDVSWPLIQEDLLRLTIARDAARISTR